MLVSAAGGTPHPTSLAQHAIPSISVVRDNYETDGEIYDCDMAFGQRRPTRAHGRVSPWPECSRRRSGYSESKRNSFRPIRAGNDPIQPYSNYGRKPCIQSTRSQDCTGLGGITVVLAAIKGIWYSSGTGERVAFIGGAAIVLAALLVSLAIIVRSDVQARSTAQAAEYAARAEIASAFLQTVERAQLDSAVSTQRYWLRTNTMQAWQAVDHFEKGAAGFVAVLADTSHTQVQCNDIQFLEYASQVS